MITRTERFKIKLEMQTLLKAYNGFETVEIHVHTRNEMKRIREVYVSYSLIWTLLFFQLHITWNRIRSFLYMLFTWIYFPLRKSLLMMYHTTSFGLITGEAGGHYIISYLRKIFSNMVTHQLSWKMKNRLICLRLHKVLHVIYSLKYSKIVRIILWYDLLI